MTATVTLEESYARCKVLNKRHGTTYYWSTYLLPAAKRPHVHALYAFCRYADDIVDDMESSATVAERAAALRSFGERFFADLETGRSDDPVLSAVVHTVLEYAIDTGCFERFLRSMTMDLSIAEYETYDDLLVYMDGSAAVIGEMMLPILEPGDTAALAPARELGLAFQLTNFLRDVGEDLDRGRIYLPQEDVRKFDADPARREVTPEWIELMRFEIDRARRHYRAAATGLAYLPPASARCVGVAHRMYGEILDRIEANGYDVFTTRARVPTPRKLALAAAAALRRGGAPTATGSTSPG